MSGGGFPLKLLVPRCGVELGKPVAKSREILTGELADRGFDLGNGAHTGKVNYGDFRTSAEAPYRYQGLNQRLIGPTNEGKIVKALLA